MTSYAPSGTPASVDNAGLRRLYRDRYQRVSDRHLVALCVNGGVDLAWTPDGGDLERLRDHLAAILRTQGHPTGQRANPGGGTDPGTYRGFELRDPFVDRPQPTVERESLYADGPDWVDVWTVGFGWIGNQSHITGRLRWWPDHGRRLERQLAGWGLAADLLPDHVSDELVTSGYPAPRGQRFDRLLRRVFRDVPFVH